MNLNIVKSDRIVGERHGNKITSYIVERGFKLKIFTKRMQEMKVDFVDFY